MKLSAVFNLLDYELIKGSMTTSIKDIKYDSRKVEPGDLYICLPGLNFNGHDYINDALNKGAIAIVISEDYPIKEDVTVIKVLDTRSTLAQISINFFDNPASKLTIIGVTGTTGKTTTTHIIKALLESLNIKCGLIGSIGIKYNDLVIPTSNTTPESYDLHAAFNTMLKNGITHVVMETSSQAFKLNRLLGITFDIGVLTNLTTDHIGPGEHASHEEYVQCKNKLFLNSKMAIVNLDSLYLKEVLNNVTIPIYTYSFKKPADLQIKDIKLINNSNFLGSIFTTTGLINDTFKLGMPGTFNIYNALCALIVVKKLGFDPTLNKEVLEHLKVRGRMETALVTDTYKVIIDYAHTSDGMQELVKTLKAYQPKRLISVFGGGGNRPKERRYNLGEIIGRESDLCIITMDNPRFENIKDINNDIKVGLQKVNAKYIEIDDRREAIRYACLNAKKGDLILLLGKGHEEYQEVKGKKIPFSEIEVINELKEV